MILREFKIKCDECGAVGERSFPYSEDLKTWARTLGWRVNNNAQCYDCRIKESASAVVRLIFEKPKGESA